MRWEFRSDLEGESVRQLMLLWFDVVWMCARVRCVSERERETCCVVMPALCVLESVCLVCSRGDAAAHSLNTATPDDDVLTAERMHSDNGRERNRRRMERARVRSSELVSAWKASLEREGEREG